MPKVTNLSQEPLAVKQRGYEKNKRQIMIAKGIANTNNRSKEVQMKVRKELVKELTCSKYIRSDYQRALQDYDLLDLPIKYKKVFIERNHLTESAQELIFGEVLV